MNINAIRQDLLHWYHLNKRELPWRETQNPYAIWVSEIILQQTQVKQGYDYYLRFMERFPDIESLASAHEDDVLKQWQGLGYYARARNLQAAAKQIMCLHQGIFPDTYEQILQLRGIGEYTAAAIASFAFNLSYATLDGNVFRVISRLYGIDTPIDSTAGKKEFMALAQELLNPDEPSNHNQAMMEMGAIQCKPINPDCKVCPLMGYCKAYNSDLVNLLPIKQGKTAQRNRYFYYLNITDGKQLLLHKRDQKDIWQGLYEFPLIETEHPIEIEHLINSPQFKDIIHLPFTLVRQSGIKKHILSHQHIYGQYIEIETQKLPADTHYLTICAEEMPQYPISRLMEKLLPKTLSIKE